MAINNVHQVYGKALFLAAGEKGTVDEVKNEINELAQFIRQNKELSVALTSKTFSHQDRSRLALDLAQKLELSPLVKKTFEILASKDRTDIIEGVAAAFNANVDESKGILRGTVTTAEVIGDSDKAELEKSFSKKFNKQVNLDQAVNKEILGGLIVTINGMTFDGSLKTSIRKIKESLGRQTT